MHRNIAVLFAFVYGLSAGRLERTPVAGALVHAMILRIQALVLPIRTLVFGGH